MEIQVMAIRRSSLMMDIHIPNRINNILSIISIIIVIISIMSLVSFSTHDNHDSWLEPTSKKHLKHLKKHIPAPRPTIPVTSNKPLVKWSTQRLNDRARIATRRCELKVPPKWTSQSKWHVAQTQPGKSSTSSWKTAMKYSLVNKHRP